MSALALLLFLSPLILDPLVLSSRERVRDESLFLVWPLVWRGLPSGAVPITLNTDSTSTPSVFQASQC